MTQKQTGYLVFDNITKEYLLKYTTRPSTWIWEGLNYFDFDGFEIKPQLLTKKQASDALKHVEKNQLKNNEDVDLEIIKVQTLTKYWIYPKEV